ncbi:hypothetical protein EHS25_006643 [Saitozyma podzolica]|uniref:ERT1/acuK family PAS domain-containing protein n=1 Tax=Saitozyma podzolica TaxID=1890683 RepID=A0A427YSB6_9TREE|nr:hypothetical protein EHS25_006643 [Saitozyma podzolica]
MVCEGGRPCERCVKRDIAHLCRDFSPPHSSKPHSAEHSIEPDPTAAAGSSTRPPAQPRISDVSISSNSGVNTTINPLDSSSQIPLYSDPNFPPAWPLLPDTAGPVTYGDVPGVGDTSRTATGNGMWGLNDDSELGALSKYLGDLGVPSLPGGFLDVLSYFGRGGSGNNLSGVPIPGIPEVKQEPDESRAATATAAAAAPLAVSGPSNAAPIGMSRTGSAKGKGKDVPTGVATLGNVSRIEKYFLAAADQPSGPRASRLAQVIKAKYDAGLLKPYDYVKGYERIARWMDSGRAAPKADSLAGSVPNSPQKGTNKNGRMAMTSTTPQPAFAGGISLDSRKRILAAMNGFRPKFRQIARTLTEVDLVFIEEAMERWMLQYDRAFASIHTPSCIWRRTGEIQKANQEFANLTGVPASMFRNGQLCVYELMDEDSAVRYWEGYAKIAFDAGQRSLYTSCTLKIPSSLSRLPRRQPFATPSQAVKAAAPAPPLVVPDLSLPGPLIPPVSGTTGFPVAHDTASDHSAAVETFREIKCCFSVTIRRDAWGVPVAIMGQWIPI